MEVKELVGLQRLEQGYCLTCKDLHKFIGTLAIRNNRLISTGTCLNCKIETLSRIVFRIQNND